MHDADYEVRDSGKKAVYPDGNQRDDPGDKPRFDLLLPEGVPYEETLLYRTAMHYMRGGKKYGDRNWEKSSTQESLEAHKKALWRHFIKFAGGIEDGEDHAAAIVWNVQAMVYTQWRLSQRIEAETPAQELTPEQLMDKLRGGAVNSDNTVEPIRVEGGLERWQTYVFPVAAAGSAGRPYFNEVKIKAPNFDAAKAELNKMLGRETAERSAELDTQQESVTAGWQEKAAEIGGSCPDGGPCRHGCVEQADWPCFRVLTCSPLSGVMPGDRWPPEVVQHNQDKEASRLLAERERSRQLCEYI